MKKLLPILLCGIIISCNPVTGHDNSAEADSTGGVSEEVLKEPPAILRMFK